MSNIDQFTNTIGHYGVYRGEVVYNNDPNNKGRVKLFIPGIYPLEFKETPELLPWAEPAMSIFGGSWMNEDYKRDDENPKSDAGLNFETGVSSVPHASKKAKVGAQLFCFLEAGDVNHPIYFAAAQTGSGWLSEYPQQHVVQTDNVSLIINEDYESVKQITEKQTATVESEDLTSEQLNTLANKNAIDFIPMVNQNDLFGGFVSDSNGIIESEDDQYYDGINFGEYYKNIKNTHDDIVDYDIAKSVIKKSKCFLNDISINPEEIDFYDNKMPICSISWDYNIPEGGSNINEKVEFYELQIGTDNKFTSIQKYRCLNNSLNLNTLHVGSYAVRVRAWTTFSGSSNWSSPQTFEIKYKKETDLEYEQDKKTRPTRVNIFIENKKGVAVNLRIHGDVSLNIDGNVTENITGNKFQNIGGNLIQTINGGMIQTIKRAATIINKDDYVHHIQGKRVQIVHSDNLQIDRGNFDHTIEGRNQLSVYGSYNQEVYGSKKVTVTSKYRLDVDSYICAANGSYMINSIGGCSIQSGGSVVISTGDNFEVGTFKNIVLTSGMNTNITASLLTHIEGTTILVKSNTNYTLSCLTAVETVLASKLTMVSGTQTLSVKGVSTFIANEHIMTPTAHHIHWGTPGGYVTLGPVK